jgi:hypothetical protein
MILQRGPYQGFQKSSEDFGVLWSQLLLLIQARLHLLAPFRPLLVVVLTLEKLRPGVGFRLIAQRCLLLFKIGDLGLKCFDAALKQQYLRQVLGLAMRLPQIVRTAESEQDQTRDNGSDERAFHRSDLRFARMVPVCEVAVN